MSSVSDYYEAELFNPVEGIITSSFGTRINPILNKEEFHNGVDIAVSVGTEVMVPSDGVVIETGTSAGYGINIKIELVNGYTVMFAHLSEILVSQGETVKKSQVVALSGNTGLSTGAHLHYTVWKDEELIDPMLFVNLEYTREVHEEYLARGEAFD